MTNSILNSLIDEVLATAAVDMTQTSTGGAGGGLMPEGYAMARMVTYIELGLQPQEFGGKAKAPAHEIRIGFKLFGEGYDGRFISTYDLAISNNEKSNTKKLFDKLNWDKGMKHFAQALGKAFLVKVLVVTNEKTKKQSNRIALDEILPPINPVTKGLYPVPEVPDAELRYFFFDKPAKVHWENLFVDGNFDDGASKNKIQEKILKALNYAGSPLEQLLSGVVLPEPDVQPVPASALSATQPSAPLAPVLPKVPVMPVPPVAPVLPE